MQNAGPKRGVCAGTVMCRRSTPPVVPARNQTSRGWFLAASSPVGSAGVRQARPPRPTEPTVRPCPRSRSRRTEGAGRSPGRTRSCASSWAEVRGSAAMGLWVPRRTVRAMDRETFWSVVETARERAGAGADDRGAEDDRCPAPSPTSSSSGSPPTRSWRSPTSRGPWRATPTRGRSGARPTSSRAGAATTPSWTSATGSSSRGARRSSAPWPTGHARRPPRRRRDGRRRVALVRVRVAGLARGDAWSRATGEDDEAYYTARERTSSGRALAEPVGEQWDFDDDEENARRLRGSPPCSPCDGGSAPGPGAGRVTRARRTGSSGRTPSGPTRGAPRSRATTRGRASRPSRARAGS